MVQKHKLCTFLLALLVLFSLLSYTLHQNNNEVQNMSGLDDYLVELLSGFLFGGHFPSLYVDGIFLMLATICHAF